jgi:pimeloyl-ACP methyl ester carboxylesterase
MDEQLGRFAAQVERPEPLKFAWPIMVLPDLFTTTQHLALLVGYFATIGWEVYAPDLSAAIGRGNLPPIEKIRFDDLLALANEARSALGREAVIVGHGIGGLVALKLAQHAGVKAAVAMAPLVPGFRSPLFMRAGNLFAIWRGLPLKPPASRVLFDLVADADPFQRAQAIKSMVPGATAAALEVARDEIELSASPIPRLIVAGGSDKFAPFAEVDKLASRIGARVAKLQSAGHWLIGGRALERAIGEIQRFLVRSLGQDLLLLYPEEWKKEPQD